MMKNRSVSACMFGLLTAMSCLGAPINLWVDDSNGLIGKVDISTGAVTLVGNAGVRLTDIAFSPGGVLYGINSDNLYLINSTTGASTLIGALGTGTDVNALVFGADGTLYAASKSLYRVNPSTGQATTVGAINFASAGDLAFINGTLYLSASGSSGSRLVSVNTATGAGTLIGNLGVSNVFGLASPDNNVLYGVAGTTIYTINTATGAATDPVDFSGHGLGTANGQAFITEAGAINSPEPATAVLLGAALFLVFGARFNRDRHKTRPGNFHSAN